MDPVDSVDSVTQTEQKQSTTTTTSTQPPGLHSFQRPAFQSAGLHSEQWEPAPCPRVSGARVQGCASVCKVVPVQGAVFSASADARTAAFSAEQLLAGQLVQRGAG